MSPICLHLYIPPFMSLHNSEWPYDPRLCYFPKADLFFGHPVVLSEIDKK